MKIVCVFLVMLNVTYFLWQARNQENGIYSPVDVATPSLMLLTELLSEGVISKPSNNIKINQVSEMGGIETSIEAQNCIVFGGFVDQLAAEQAIRLLSQYGVVPKLNTVETQGTASYLVYLPPFKSRAEALTNLHELQASGIDSFIIGEGERVNGISLGVFAKEESAKKLQTQLKSKGYNSSIVNSSRVIRQHNLLITDQSEQMLTENSIDEISQKYAQGKLTRTKSACF